MIYQEGDSLSAQGHIGLDIYLMIWNNYVWKFGSRDVNTMQFLCKTFNKKMYKWQFSGSLSGFNPKKTLVRRYINRRGSLCYDVFLYFSGRQNRRERQLRQRWFHIPSDLVTVLEKDQLTNVISLKVKSRVERLEAAFTTLPSSHNKRVCPPCDPVRLKTRGKPSKSRSAGRSTIRR